MKQGKKGSLLKEKNLFQDDTTRYFFDDQRSRGAYRKSLKETGPQIRPEF